MIMPEDRGVRTQPMHDGSKYDSTDGQHRSSGGRPGGDTSGIRSRPEGYSVGEERGGDQQDRIPGRKRPMEDEIVDRVQDGHLKR